MAIRSVSPPKRGRPKGSKSFDAESAQAFGAIIRESRLAAGISQEALAYSANIERSYFGRIERGESQPTLFVILKICAALGIESGTIVGLVDEAIKGSKRTTKG